MTFIRSLATFALLAFVAVPAFAQDSTAKTSGEKCTQCPNSSTSLTSTQDQEECTACPIMTAAMEKLPKMTYKVGDEATCCSASAEALAKEHSQPIHFVVGDQTFEDKAAALHILC